MASGPLSFQGHPDFDLVHRIWKARRPQQQVFKVKTHQSDFTNKMLLQIYHALGNEAANEAAIQANKKHLPEVRTELEQQQDRMNVQRRDLALVYQYIVDLQLARAQADHPNDEHTQQPLPHDMIQLLRTCRPQVPWTAPELQGQDSLKACSWGHQTATAVLQFCQSCEWPADNEAPGGQDVGISWAEIAVGLALTLGTWLPVRRANRRGNLRLVWIKNHQEAVAQHVTLAEQSETASKLFRQVHRLLATDIFPSGCYGRVRSLYVLGESYIGKGFRCRPSFPRQSEMLDMMLLSIQERRQLPTLEGEVQQWQCDQTLGQIDFSQLLIRGRKASSNVKH
eukprot:Skav221258  [mRNA]  locus=scaffold1045:766429:767445:+ [translate_table: standard]